MDPDGAVMTWSLVTADGDVIDESRCHWSDLPADIRITRLRYRDARGVTGALAGFDAYGFQRYGVYVPAGDGTIADHGVELIGIAGDEATVVTVSEPGGHRSQKSMPLSELTYSRSLIRNGVVG